MPKSCWMIERGEYSDYCVVGIFSTEDKAKQALEVLADPDAYHSPPSIREVAMDEGVSEIQRGLRIYYVLFRNHSLDDSVVSVTKELRFRDAEHTKHNSLYHIWASDEAHAMKIAAERHTAWLMSPTRSEV